MLQPFRRLECSIAFAPSGLDSLPADALEHGDADPQLLGSFLTGHAEAGGQLLTCDLTGQPALCLHGGVGRWGWSGVYGGRGWGGAECWGHAASARCGMSSFTMQADALLFAAMHGYPGSVPSVPIPVHASMLARKYGQQKAEGQRWW